MKGQEKRDFWKQNLWYWERQMIAWLQIQQTWDELLPLLSAEVAGQRIPWVKKADSIH